MNSEKSNIAARTIEILEQDTNGEWGFDAAFVDAAHEYQVMQRDDTHKFHEYKEATRVECRRYFGQNKFVPMVKRKAARPPKAPAKRPQAAA